MHFLKISNRTLFVLKLSKTSYHHVTLNISLKRINNNMGLLNLHAIICLSDIEQQAFRTDFYTFTFRTGI